MLQHYKGQCFAEMSAEFEVLYIVGQRMPAIMKNLAYAVNSLLFSYQYLHCIALIARIEEKGICKNVTKHV